MANQRVDYKYITGTGDVKDMGERTDEEAIQPYNDGEPANETIFRRPNENLRYRTEIARDEVEIQKYLPIL